jgi:hypothetical protein
MSQTLRLNAVERAILFTLYDKVEPDQHATLCGGSTLSRPDASVGSGSVPHTSGGARVESGHSDREPTVTD